MNNPYQCIQCGGVKVEKKRLRNIILFTGLLLIGIGIGLYALPYVNFLGIVLLIVGGVFTIISPMAQHVLVCHDCGKAWNPNYYRPKKAVRP